MPHLLLKLLKIFKISDFVRDIHRNFVTLQKIKIGIVLLSNTKRG